MDDAGAALSLLLGLGGLVAALRTLLSHPDPAGRFADSYAPVNARILDCLLLAGDQAVGMVLDRTFKGRVGPFAANLSIVTVCILVPLVAVVAGSSGLIGEHGIAFGLGALAWSSVVELAGSPQRVRRFMDREIIDVPVWAIALALVIVDLLIVVVAPAPTATTSEFGFALIGAALVAFADFISAAVALFVAAPARHLLKDRVVGS